MKKTIFLMLWLFVLSAASVNAQVVIGGNATSTPHASAILDLQTDGSGNLGLLLPSVALNSDSDTSIIAEPKNGLLVCNMEGDLAKGVYYWNGQWVLYIKFE